MVDAPGTNEDEFYGDEAQDEFPAKEDLKDRLVAIWPTGKVGTRKSEVDGSTYPYVETLTVVLDDGPEGWKPTRYNGDPMLVESVAVNGPQVLNRFQWSASGIYSRVEPRHGTTDKPLCGRINARKNKIKGMSDAWGIAKLTDEDRDTIRKATQFLKAEYAKLQAASDKEIFD